MNLTLGFSPCPNDTFIFDALVNGNIDAEGLAFETVLEDVQTFNSWAAEGKQDVTKLSFPALFANADTYEILDAGAALGNGVGPLLVGKKMVDVGSFDSCRIAIPGKNTTANLLLRYAFPQIKNTVELVFHSIEDAVCNEQVEMGVIIHENRFTYHTKGLHKICDLGEIWENREHLPIPLGCIAIRRSLPADVKETVNHLLKKSVETAMQSDADLSAYVKANAQAMQEDVMRKHIELYVNNYTVSLGDTGRTAIEKLHAVYSRNAGLEENSRPLFFN